VADRRQFRGKAFKKRSRTSSIHVMGLCQKFRNIHVALSRLPVLAAIGRLRYAELDMRGMMSLAKAELDLASSIQTTPHI
jgi:hypothetical protein